MLRPSFRVRTGRAAWQKIALLALLFAAVFFVPYMVRPPLAISRSYVAGYSNRVALVVLLAGIGLFAWFTGGEVYERQDRDSRLPVSALLVALLVSLLACVYGPRWPPLQIPGGESLYFLNRQQMLATGRAPYLQFEFSYGPLLLYPSLWAQRLLHVSAMQGYIVAWTGACLAGTAMIWVVVRLLDPGVPSRVLLFAFLVLGQLIWLDMGGPSYTAFRAFCAAFCIAGAHALWTRTQRPWWMACGCVAGVAFSLLCSVEQAIGVALGLNAYMLLLCAHRRWRFPLQALLFSLAGSLGCFAAAAHLGMLRTFRSFASGGYSYPVLPSPSIILALFAYVVAGCALFETLRAGRLDSVVVPLALGGAAMLPVALGRSDMLHITAATPLFVVGVAAIFSMPKVRRWWVPLASLALIVLPPALVRKDDIFDAIWRMFPAASDWADDASDALNTSQNQWYLSAAQIPSSALPCDRQYFSPSFMPLPFEPFRTSCLETGYYLGYTNVITPETIANKIDELRQHADWPLLMENTPLEEQLPLQLVTMDSLHAESASFWVPPQRNAPLTYASLIGYIRTHYEPGPVLAQGRLRVWNPRSVR